MDECELSWINEFMKKCVLSDRIIKGHLKLFSTELKSNRSKDLEKRVTSYYTKFVAQKSCISPKLNSEYLRKTLVGIEEHEKKMIPELKSDLLRKSNETFLGSIHNTDYNNKTKDFGSLNSYNNSHMSHDTNAGSSTSSTATSSTPMNSSHDQKKGALIPFYTKLKLSNIANLSGKKNPKSLESDLINNKKYVLMLCGMIGALNTVYPDYDFVTVPLNWFIEISLAEVLSLVNVKLAEVAIYKDPMVMERLWNAIDAVIGVKSESSSNKVKIFQYIPGPDEPVNGGDNSCTLWHLNLFFFNAERKVMLYFTCAAYYTVYQSISDSESDVGSVGSYDSDSESNDTALSCNNNNSGIDNKSDMTMEDLLKQSTIEISKKPKSNKRVSWAKELTREKLFRKDLAVTAKISKKKVSSLSMMSRYLHSRRPKSSLSWSNIDGFFG